MPGEPLRSLTGVSSLVLDKRHDGTYISCDIWHVGLAQIANEQDQIVRDPQCWQLESPTSYPAPCPFMIEHCNLQLLE